MSTVKAEHTTSVLSDLNDGSPRSEWFELYAKIGIGQVNGRPWWSDSMTCRHRNTRRQFLCGHRRRCWRLHADTKWHCRQRWTCCWRCLLTQNITQNVYIILYTVECTWRVIIIVTLHSFNYTYCHITFK